MNKIHALAKNLGLGLGLSAIVSLTGCGNSQWQAEKKTYETLLAKQETALGNMLGTLNKQTEAMQMISAEADFYKENYEALLGAYVDQIEDTDTCLALHELETSDCLPPWKKALEMERVSNSTDVRVKLMQDYLNRGRPKITEAPELSK